MAKTSHENEQLEELINQFDNHSKISLYQHHLNDEDMHVVVQVGINEKRCNELWLEKNQITSIGASIIANALNNNCSVMWLSLSSNRLGDKGIQALANSLTLNNSTLHTLALHSTGITDTGAEYLAEMLEKNATLIELGLSGNEIGNRGVELLAKTLTHQNNTLRWFYLSKNRLVNDSCVDCLVQMLEYNRRVQALWIDNCNLSSQGKQRLQWKAESKTSFNLKI